MSRLLVTGSREWAGQNCIDRMEGPLISARRFLRAIYGDDVILMHGGARGADLMAATIWGNHYGTRFIKKYKADWERYRRAAGHIRNQAMVDDGPDLCLAFPMAEKENIGTRNCVERARAKNVPVIVVWNDGERYML